MATYAYRCLDCGAYLETTIHGHYDGMIHCTKALVRDYQAEAVGIGITQLKREREHPKEEYMAKFLPSNKDFVGPNDPDGKKGMRQWREEHQPKAGNKKPWWPGEV